MLRFILRATLVAWLVCVGGGFANAQETTTYSYDALGRLIGVTHVGGPSTGIAVAYTYDPASNRTSYVSTNVLISIASASANEGTSLVFTVTRSGATTAATTVNYATSNASAIAGTNYTASSGNLIFAAGVTSQTITVPTIDDHVYTPNLTMTITLSSPSSGAVLGTASATGTVVNIDAQSSTLSIANASTNEGSPLTFAVTRSGTTSGAVTATYATANGTALAGTNYTATGGTVSFASGVTSQTITVPTIDDHVVTASLGMAVTLSAPTGGATLGTATASGTIANIDAAGWSSTLTSGTWSFCYTTCIYLHGYLPSLSVGAMTNTLYSGFTISALESSGSSIVLNETGSATPPNSGWTSITIPGVGTLLRSAATYSSSTGSASWTWTSAATVASGTVTIQ